MNNRHILICKRAQNLHPELQDLVLLLKGYLQQRDCQSSYSGGLSSFLLFYMVLAFFQLKKPSCDLPLFVRFLRFYSEFDQTKFGLQIDKSKLFPEEGFRKEFSVIIEVPSYVQKGQLYLKDPIGKQFYADPSEYKTYKENAAASAFEYERVKDTFSDTYKKIMNSMNPDFSLLMTDRGGCSFF